MPSNGRAGNPRNPSAHPSHLLPNGKNGHPSNSLSTRTNGTSYLAPENKTSLTESPTSSNLFPSTQEALHFTDAFFRNTLTCLALLDRDFNFIQVNDAYAKACGRSVTEFPGHNHFEFYPSDAQAIFETVRQTKTPYKAIARPFTYPDHPEWGVTYWDWTLEPILDAAGEISFFILLLRDVTEYKKVEAQLQQSKQFLSSVLEHLPSMVFVKDADSLRFVQLNKAGEELLGYCHDELVGKNDYDFFPQQEADFFTAKDREVLSSGRLLDIAEEPIQTRDKGLRILHTKKIPIFDEHGQPRYLLGLSEDITERKRMETQLLQSEERFRRLIEVSSQLVWGADARGLWGGDFTSWEKFTGRSPEESTGWRWLNAIHPDDRIRVAETWRDAVKQQAPCKFEVRVHHHNSGYRDTICHAAPLFNEDGTVREWIGMNIDITERKLAESRLGQASKLEAIGKLAGGIAHDFNNLLTVIKGYNEMMLHSVPPTDPLHSSLLEVKGAAQRAAALTQQLLTFSRQQVVQPQILQLNGVITGLTSMLQRLIGEQIHLVTSLEPNLDMINIDPIQIEQVIINLAVNARDAMPNGGTLTIETANTDSIANGPSVRLTIRDTGMGIDDSTLPHIFEPFYTTKPVGQGTGLGLAVVYGIVTQNGGRIRVRSQVKQGSTFIIKFPSAGIFPIEADVAPTKLEDQAIPSIHQRETILVTEDDDSVRRYLKHALAAYDYQVLEAASPDEALQQANQFGQKIQLLITDMVMPGMNGQELAARILNLNPTIKVLLISGYTDTMETPHDPAGSPIHFLDKPFTPHTFMHMVRHILDEDAHPASHECLNGAKP